MQIPVDDYLADALQLTPAEGRLRQEFAAWLPDDIIDCHAHCNLRAHVSYVSDRAFGHMLSTFTYFSLKDSATVNALLHPGTRVRSLRFPKTFEGIDHRAANAYLLEESSTDDRIAVFGLPEDVGYTVRMLRHPRCSALKMYWSYINPPAERIYDFFRPEILEEAQALDMPIILHLPKMIVRSLPDLVHLLEDFPRLRIVLAHLGLPKMLVPGLAEAYQAVKDYDNVMLDTALNPSDAVMHLALSTFGSGRIMFGSDQPLHLIRSVAFLHPAKGERLATAYKYHWVDPAEHAEFSHLAVGATHAHWQSLTAIKRAVERFPQSMREDMKRRIFRENASVFFGF